MPCFGASPADDREMGRLIVSRHDASSSPRRGAPINPYQALMTGAARSATSARSKS